MTGAATDSLIDAVGNHLVPMYRVIGPTAAVALLILFLVGVARMLADIEVRAIAIARVRGCGWWLIGAFWGTLFHMAIAPVQSAMARGHTVAKPSATRRTRKPLEPQTATRRPRGSTLETQTSRRGQEGRSTTWTGW